MIDHTRPRSQRRRARLGGPLGQIRVQRQLQRRFQSNSRPIIDHHDHRNRALRTATANVPGTTGVVPSAITTPPPTADHPGSVSAGPTCDLDAGCQRSRRHRNLPFMVVNQRTTPCQVGGYIGVSIYDPVGHELTATATREPGNGTEEALQAIILQPGGTASFTVTVNEIPSSGSSCPMIGAFHLTPPNATVYLQVSVESSGHLYCGQPKVFPTQPGTR